MAGRNQTFYELRERFQQMATKSDKQACPICQLTLEGGKRYLELLSYENVTNPAERAKTKSSGGFCNRHTWDWSKLNDALGTALVYGDVAKVFAEKLQNGELGQPRNEGKFWKKLLTQPRSDTNGDNAVERTNAPGMVRREDLGLGRCPACIVEDEVQTRVVEEFADGLTDAAFRDAYTASAGICVPHLVSVLEILSDDGTRRFLQQTEQRKWQEIQAELDLVVDRQNFDFHKGAQAHGDEIYAVKRSLWKAAGLNRS